MGKRARRDRIQPRRKFPEKTRQGGRVKAGGCELDQCVNDLPPGNELLELVFGAVGQQGFQRRGAGGVRELGQHAA